MWELDCEEGWVPKNWCFWTVVLEKTLESPLDFKEIQPVHSKGDQPWVLFGGNDAKAETPVLWPPHAKSWLTARDWCWEGLGAGVEGDDRGWDGWMALPTWCTWVWVNSGSWWWTGRPGVLPSMGSQRVRHDWVTELTWNNEQSLLMFLVSKWVLLGSIRQVVTQRSEDILCWWGPRDVCSGQPGVHLGHHSASEHESSHLIPQVPLGTSANVSLSGLLPRFRN